MCCHFHLRHRFNELMFGNNLTQVITSYRQLDRTFLVDTRLAKQLGLNTRSIELVQHVFLYFIYPLCLAVNILQLAVANRGRLGVLYMKLFSISNMIVLTFYLFNFIHYDNRSLVSFNGFTCKAFSFSIRLLTAFHSWVYMLMMSLVVKLFDAKAHRTSIAEIRPPSFVTKPTKIKTTMSPYIKRILILFISLSLVYSFELVVMDQIKYETMIGNVSIVFRRCGIPDNKKQRILILVSNIIDLVTFGIAPFVLISIRACMTMKKLVEKKNRSAQLLASEFKSEQGIRIVRPSSYAIQTKLANFLARLRRIFIFRSIVFFISTLPLSVYPICYVIYVWFSESSPLDGHTLVNLDLAFTILCLNNLLTSGLITFIIAFYLNKLFRQAIFDLSGLNWLKNIRAGAAAEDSA